ncbi:nucleotidyltransferase family protein [Chitinophagaceae bacterium MMS25-I14]
MECIILAGGLGTRLQGVIGAYPKCMATVNGKPFLHYLFTYLQQQNCTRAILSLGFKNEVVTEWLDTVQWPFDIDFVVEPQPLGTGGGIRLAMEQATEEQVFVLNGDTIFCADLSLLLSSHIEKHAETTLALKHMLHFDRYGVVNTDEAGHIISFEEKQQRDQGLINGGIYVIDRQKFLSREMPEHFSFEKHYLELFVKEKKFFGFCSDAYFLDIGIPEDYAKAQEDFTVIF